MPPDSPTPKAKPTTEGEFTVNSGRAEVRSFAGKRVVKVRAAKEGDEGYDAANPGSVVCLTGDQTGTPKEGVLFDSELVPVTV